MIFCKSYLRLSAFICILCLGIPPSATAAAEIETDICILSATPAGISAAVAASRLGSKVVLIERTSHIGGLPANGLGVTDIATRATIGGLFKEFVTAVKQHYVKTYGADSQQAKDCSDGYHFEPHVAEQVFEGLLSNAANVHVLRRHQFDGQAEVENQKLKSIIITDRGSGEKIQIKAKAFIDATYEGDLAASAGVPYRIGREGRDETLEPYAGVFYSYFGTKEIYDDPRTGQGDHRIQAYNYRLCLTDRPDLRVLPTKPATYRREDYASLAEDIQKTVGDCFRSDSLEHLGYRSTLSEFQTARATPITTITAWSPLTCLRKTNRGQKPNGIGAINSRRD